jgi:multicomponent Na+:H+ antiporter subunit B
MTSLILRATTSALEPLLLLYSLFLLFAGHNEPGGGFSGGLVASAVFALHLLAYDASSTRRMLVVRPEALVGTGLLLSMVAGLWGGIWSRPFLTGTWVELPLGGVDAIAIGTPTLFDVGVYVVVVGVSMVVLLSLAETQDEDAR